MIFTYVYKSLKSHEINDFYRKQTSVRQVHLSLSKILKISEKVDLITVKITQILVYIQKKFLDIVRIFYKTKCANIS